MTAAATEKNDQGKDQDSVAIVEQMTKAIIIHSAYLHKNVRYFGRERTHTDEGIRRGILQNVSGHTVRGALINIL